MLEDFERKSPPVSMMSVLAYLGVLIIIPILTDWRNDPFVKFHIKQGIILLILEFIAMFIDSIPFGGILTPVVWMAIFIFIVLGIINVASMKARPLPLIGRFAEKIDF